MWVIDPDLYDNAKDPGEIVRRHGPSAWQRTSAAPVCSITAHAVALAGPIPTWEGEPGRRAGLARATAWLATPQPRYSIEQARALDTVASTLGYDTEATQRTFRAQHWHEHVTRRGPRRGIDR